MDDVSDEKRNELNKYQEDMYIDGVMERIRRKLTKWLSNYQNCKSYVISKIFIYYILIQKLRKKDIELYLS